MHNLIDKFTHEFMAILIDRRLKSMVVFDVLSDRIILLGGPEYLLSDNDPEFVVT